MLNHYERRIQEKISRSVTAAPQTRIFNAHTCARTNHVNCRFHIVWNYYFTHLMIIVKYPTVPYKDVSALLWHSASPWRQLLTRLMLTSAINVLREKSTNYLQQDCILVKLDSGRGYKHNTMTERGDGEWESLAISDGMTIQVIIQG